MDLAVWPPEEHESTAADVPGLRINNRQREADCDGGIHRVASLLHDGDANLGSLGMHGRDHGFRSMNRPDGIAGDCLNGQGQDQHRQYKAQFHNAKLQLSERTALKISSEQ
jgi:hypothetical protein